MKYWLFTILLCACGSKSQVPVQPVPANGPSEDAGSSEADPTAQADALGDQECEALFEHVFQIAIADQEASLPEEERPTPADVTKAKANMRKELLGQCIGASRVEFHYDCAIEATDRAALQSCVGNE
jgi:hypothetical protein